MPFRRLISRPPQRTPVAVPGPAPLVLGIGMVKNEQDVIEPFVRHNLRFLDALVLVDNGSVDATRDILAALTHELPGLAVTDTPQFGYHQAERMTRLLAAAQEAVFADFVLPLDADEFLRAPDRAAFHAALARIPPGGVGLLPWQTLVPSPDGSPADPPRSLTYRRAREQPLYAKAVLRLDGALARGWALTQGNHAATRDGAAIAPSLTFEDIALLHAPVRSAAQIAAKTVVGWMAYMAKDPAARAGTDGYQWRTLFDGVARGEPILPETVTAMALNYAQDAAEGDWRARTVADDPGWTYQRRHSTGAPSDPLALVARSWEQSLAQPPPALTLAAPAALSDAAPAASGAFTETWHWDNLFVDVPFARFLIERFRPASVLDVGCGIGAYVTLFAQHGTQARGVDGLPLSATALTAADYRQHDLAAPLYLGGRFDLVLCLEVAEHLDASHGATLLDSILRHASGAVVFSAAEPGQPGNGHVNCRPLADWLDQFRARGWLPDWPDSAGLRAVASLAWLRRNPVVLRRVEQVAQDGTARLLAIAARPFAWYGQQPGIRASFLDEPAPPPGGGYG